MQMTHRFPSFIAAFLLVSVFCCPPVSAREENVIPDIKQILSGGPTREGARAWADITEQKIKEEPENYKHYDVLAVYYDYLGSYEKAIEALNQEIRYYPEGEPGLESVYGNLARQYLALDRLEEAKAHIDKALSFDRNNVLNRMHLLSYYFKKNDYEKLAYEIKEVCDLNKNFDYYHDLYLYILNNKVRVDDFVGIFRRFVEVNPQSAFARKALATVMRHDAFGRGAGVQEMPAILEEYNKARELNPKYVATYLAIGNTYLYAADATHKKAYYKDAMRWYKKVQKLEPDNLDVTYLMGYLFYHRREYKKAIEKLEYAFNKGLRNEYVTDTLAVAYNNAAVECYEKKGNLQRGLELVDKALEFDSKAAIPLSTKTELLFKMGRLHEAEEYISKVVAVKPDSDFFAFLGREQETYNDFALAKRYYQEAIRLNPDNAVAICNLGLVHASLSEYGEAIACCQRYIRLSPEDFRGYYNVGIVYLKLGDKENASRQVAKLADLKQGALAARLDDLIKSGRSATSKARLIDK